MRILLAEDDHRLAASLRRSLIEARMAVDVVHDGEEALAAGFATTYDAIVLDVMLPHLSGFDVTRRLRDRNIESPILMLTARDSVDDRVAGLDSGADDYLVKPFALREVLARLRALTRRHVPNRKAALQVGEVVLDTSSHILTVAGKPVELTTKEFAILEYFMLSRGRLLTRSQVLEHVWDYDFEGGRNLIEVYIGRLRGKLIQAGVGDPFVTVRGAGYRYSSS
jgi:DNA-binding response OmpR family regulator